MIFELFRWWYGSGWRRVALGIKNGPRAVERNFSVATLLETLFAPWKRIVTPRGRTIDAKVQAMIDNLISRAIGFVVRLFVLLAAGASIVLAFVGSTALALAWPLVPAAILVCIVKAVTG